MLLKKLEHSAFYLILLTSVVLGKPLQEFELKHMKEVHRMEVGDNTAFFKIHDLNNDGNWSREEIENMYALERKVDPLSEHIKHLVQTVLDTMDTDKDGLVSQKEYMDGAHLPVITKEHEKVEKVAPKAKKQQKNAIKRGADYEFVVPAKFRV
ncbi:hypothetical protein BY458DRAFT_514266 [Sporodiniella umbellata]|nr:hypothetical protein BY458DRAFT_514266 [Sporodiniella umbellata]